jgi:hypothetical protein
MINFTDNIPLELHGQLNGEYISEVFNILDTLPEKINKTGVSLDTLEKAVISAQQELNKAKKNLDVAEATAIMCPEKLLKNDAERKAYVTLKTQTENALIAELENKKLYFQSSLLDINREYRKLTDMYASAKHKATLINGILEYLNK